jgi:hypothetical protein
LIFDLLIVAIRDLLPIINRVQSHQLIDKDANQLLECCLRLWKQNVDISPLLQVFARYASNRKFIITFIGSRNLDRRELLSLTLNDDNFFRLLLRYLSADQQQLILVKLGEAQLIG